MIEFRSAQWNHEEHYKIVERERKEREQAHKQKQQLAQKLKTMQEKLLMGGQLMDKAAKQEYELRQAHIELEERRRQELELARYVVGWLVGWLSLSVSLSLLLCQQLLSVASFNSDHPLSCCCLFIFF